MKKLLSVLLVLTLAFSFTACSGKNADENSADAAAVTEAGGYLLKNDESVELGTPDSTLNPQDIYSSITYTPEMFFGTYTIKNSGDSNSSEMTQYVSDMDTIAHPEFEGSTITKLPFKAVSGPETTLHIINKETSHNWIKMYYMTDAGYLYDIMFAYEINGNKLELTRLKSSNFDETTNKLTYELDESFKLEYEFAFSGRELTLSCDGKSVALFSGLDVEAANDYFYVENYLNFGSKSIDGIKQISFMWDAGETRFYVETEEETVQNATALLSEDGLFTMTVPFESGTKTYQFVYFYGNNDGIVLTDGTNTYYYNLGYSAYMKGDIGSNIDAEQVATLDAMSDSELEALVEKQNDLFDDLTAAFSAAGITVEVNKETGEIAMDSTVLFGGDSAELTAEGKAFLDKFITAYTSIIYNSKYQGFITKTMVEGHIAPVSGTTYEGGLPLSQERADNVKAYCLSVAGVDATALDASLETIGYSQSKPVYDADGNVDFDSSRRVSFRFIINLD